MTVKWKRKCAFLSCNVTNLTHGMQLHPFAKPWVDREVCLRWIQCSGRTDLTADMITKNTYICTPHYNICNRLTAPTSSLSQVTQSDVPPSCKQQVSTMTTTMTVQTVASSCTVFSSTTSCRTICSTRPSPASIPFGENQSKSDDASDPVVQDVMDEEMGVQPLPISPIVNRKSHDVTIGSPIRKRKPLVPDEYILSKRRLYESKHSDGPRKGKSDAETFKTPRKVSRKMSSHSFTPKKTPEVDSPSFFSDASPRKTYKTTPSTKKISRIHTASPLKKASQILKRAVRTRAQIPAPCVQELINGVEKVSRETQTEHWMSARMSYEQCVQENEFQYFCGLSPAHFDHLYSFVGGDAKCKYLKYVENQATPKVAKQKRKKKLSLKSKLFLTLVRLRRGFQEEELAYFFGVNQPTVSKVVRSWVQLLFLEMKRLSPFILPSAAEQQLTKPVCFQPFDDVRVVVDTTAVKLQGASDFRQQGNLYAHYYAHNCVKFMIGVTLKGAVCFVSEGVEGRASDAQIFLESGIMDWLESGDSVMADRGFLVHAQLAEKGIKLITPPFVNSERTPFTPGEELLTKQIAAARIHVERRIRDIKLWRLLNSVIPQAHLAHISQAIFVCAHLVNYMASENL